MKQGKAGLTLENITEVLLRIVGPAGVGWIVDEDGPGLTVNKALHFLEINLPRPLGLQKKKQFKSAQDRQNNNNHDRLTKRL